MIKKKDGRTEDSPKKVDPSPNTALDKQNGPGMVSKTLTTDEINKFNKNYNKIIETFSTYDSSPYLTKRRFELALFNYQDNKGICIDIRYNRQSEDDKLNALNNIIKINSRLTEFYSTN
jgi:hypothetical protein